MADKQTLLITAALAIVIIAAIGIMIYVNLPTGENTLEDSSQETDDSVDDSFLKNATFLCIYGKNQKTYTVAELEKIQQYDGTGSKIKTGMFPQIIIDGPYSFSGVKITTLLDDVDVNDTNYTVCITSSDGYQSNLTYNEIQGEIPVYNTTGEIIRNDNVTIMLAIKENGEYITEDDGGPFKVVIVGEDAITSSSYWPKWAVSLEIIDG